MHIERLIDWLAKEKGVIGRPGLGPYLTRWVMRGERIRAARQSGNLPAPLPSVGPRPPA